MANSQHLRKQKTVDFLMEFYDLHHEEYYSLLCSYEQLCEEKNRLEGRKHKTSRYNLRKEESCPNWAEFLTKGRGEAIEFLWAKNPSTLLAFKRAIAGGAYPPVIRALTDTIPNLKRYVRDYGKKTGSEFGADPSACGSGRHKGGNSGSSEFS